MADEELSRSRSVRKDARFGQKRACDAESFCLMLDWPTWKRIPTINLPGRKLRPALNGSAVVMMPTRSVDLNLARRFNAGIVGDQTNLVASATNESFQSSLRDDHKLNEIFPGLERPG